MIAGRPNWKTEDAVQIDAISGYWMADLIDGNVILRGQPLIDAAAR